MGEKPHWLQVLMLVVGELAFAVIAFPLYIFLVLPNHPAGTLPGFSPPIAPGVDPLVASLGALAIVAVSLGLVWVLCRIFGYERFQVEEVEILVREFTALDLVPVYAAAGFAEEFLFRVVLTDAFGLLVGSALFTAVHAAYWKKPLLLLDVFVLALLLGAFYLHTRSLLLVAIAHGVYNLALSILMKRGLIPGQPADAAGGRA